MSETFPTSVDQPATKQTTCCIVGAGPAGVMLAWLLAWRGVAVTLLERHEDFDRDFRGDTLHPGTLEILASMGLVEQVLALPHARISTVAFHTDRGSLTIADLGCLRTCFPFVAMLPQARFLEVVARDACRFATFELVMGADARALIEQDGAVCGVSYVDTRQQTHEVRAELVVATDGRASRLRRESGLKAICSSPAIDVLWLRLPRREDQQGGGYFAAGQYMIVLERESQWQIGYVIPKGGFAEMKSAGIDLLRQSIARLAPSLAASAEYLTDWRQVHLLSVQADRLRRWYRPGLLLLGDAAHVMSPVVGVGINCAIQDAVEAANVLTEPLRTGRLAIRHLRAVQRRRAWPTFLIQTMQAMDQRLVERALRSTGGFRLPWWFRVLFRLPVLRHLPSRLFAFGVWRVRVRGLDD